MCIFCVAFSVIGGIKIFPSFKKRDERFCYFYSSLYAINRNSHEWWVKSNVQNVGREKRTMVDCLFFVFFIRLFIWCIQVNYTILTYILILDAHVRAIAVQFQAEREREREFNIHYVDLRCWKPFDAIVRRNKIRFSFVLYPSIYISLYLSSYLYLPRSVSKCPTLFSKVSDPNTGQFYGWNEKSLKIVILWILFRSIKRTHTNASRVFAYINWILEYFKYID